LKKRPATGIKKKRESTRSGKKGVSRGARISFIKREGRNRIGGGYIGKTRGGGKGLNVKTQHFQRGSGFG